MNPEDFRSSPAGRLVPIQQGQMAFVPNPLPPPNLNLGKLAGPLASATLALGELSGIGRTLPNPHLLIRPFTRLEAIASSKIEGTVTTVPELLILEASADPAKARTDTREVNNYTRALQHGLERLPTLPISKRLMSEIHAVLLAGVSDDRGARFVPGEFKKDQNWIGARLLQNAKFIPSPPMQSIDALDDLEKYIHQQKSLPVLIRLALIHYQFETIHPFPDGNGRVGRLLIPLILCEEKALSQPLLYLSTFFEKNYDKYIDLMFEVSKSGAWEPWIEFFLEGVESSARNAIRKSHALQDLHHRYLKSVQSARASILLTKMIEELFHIPALSIPSAMMFLKITYNSAKNNMKRLVDLGILSPRVPASRPQFFFATEILDVVFADDSK